MFKTEQDYGFVIIVDQTSEMHKTDYKSQATLIT